MELARVGVVDVHYDDGGQATAALVVCGDMDFSLALSEHVSMITRTEPYEPGAFYKRELPCIEAVVALGPPLELLVVDGYATLDADGRPGLGARAASALGIPVIGVAKTAYRTATHATKVFRNGATRALYVTAAGGIDIKDASTIVLRMVGPYRLPTALVRADQLSRGLVRPVQSPHLL